MAACSPAVPLLSAAACATPTNCANAPSNASTAGPVVSQSDSRTATTAATSSASIACRPYGSIDGRTGRPPSMAGRSIIDQLEHVDRAQPLGVGVGRVHEAVQQLLAFRVVGI